MSDFFGTGTWQLPNPGNYGGIPYNQTYGGQPAPFRDSTSQILATMQHSGLMPGGQGQTNPYYGNLLPRYSFGQALAGSSPNQGWAFAHPPFNGALPTGTRLDGSAPWGFPTQYGGQGGGASMQTTGRQQMGGPTGLLTAQVQPGRVMDSGFTGSSAGPTVTGNVGGSSQVGSVSPLGQPVSPWVASSGGGTPNPYSGQGLATILSATGGMSPQMQTQLQQAAGTGYNPNRDLHADPMWESAVAQVQRGMDPAAAYQALQGGGNYNAPSFSLQQLQQAQQQMAQTPGLIQQAQPNYLQSLVGQNAYGQQVTPGLLSPR